MADGGVEGDVRGLRQMLADCEQYLKEGETPAQRIERERRDTEAVLNLLVREKQRTEAMREALAWYGAEARALAKNMEGGAHTNAVLASLTVLSLDAGQRAVAALGHNVRANRETPRDQA